MGFAVLGDVAAQLRPMLVLYQVPAAGWAEKAAAQSRGEQAQVGGQPGAEAITSSKLRQKASLLAPACPQHARSMPAFSPESDHMHLLLCQRQCPWRQHEAGDEAVSCVNVHARALQGRAGRQAPITTGVVRPDASAQQESCAALHTPRALELCIAAQALRKQQG